MNRVYRSINKPELLLGVERRAFFINLGVAIIPGFPGVGIITSLGESLIVGAVIFLALSAASKALTRKDPEMLSIVVMAMKQESMYDAGDPD